MREDIPADIASRGQPPGEGRRGGGGYSMPGGGLPALPPGSSGATAPFSLSVQAPFVVRPPTAGEIQVDASGTGFTVANTPAVIPGSVVQVPTNNLAILRSMVLSVNTMLTTSLLTWTLRVNGSPVQGWSAMTIFPRNAGYAAGAFESNETFIHLDDGALIDAQINVLPGDANTYQAGITFHGWYYNKRLAEAFAPAYR